MPPTVFLHATRPIAALWDVPPARELNMLGDHLPLATWEMLEFRAGVLRRLRQFFEQRGFVEVETPLLSQDTVVDVHIDPVPVTLFRDPCEPHLGPQRWLQTSPEFAMKRLLAVGAQRIFQVCKAFRGGESGDWHNPEFTMVEWYRVGDGYEEGKQLLAELAAEFFPAFPVEPLTYQAAFERHLGVNPHLADVQELKKLGRRLPGSPPPELGDERDEWLNFLLATQVEPQLGRHGPTILCDYPASQAALARTRIAGPGRGYEVAERFELYVRGVELANGYHELLDADILRQRNEIANAARIASGRYALPVESRLLAAMSGGLPACAGCALGFDRLVALLAGSDNVRSVMAFPDDRA